MISLLLQNFMPVLCQLLARCSSLSCRDFQPHERSIIRVSHWQLEFFFSVLSGGVSKPHSGVAGEWNAKRYKWRRVFSGANQFCRFADILLEMSEKKSNNAGRISAFYQDKQWVDASSRLSVMLPSGYFVYQAVSEISLKSLLKRCRLGPRSNSLDFGTDSHAGETACWKFTLPKQT